MTDLTFGITADPSQAEAGLDQTRDALRDIKQETQNRSHGRDVDNPLLFTATRQMCDRSESTRVFWKRVQHLSDGLPTKLKHDAILESVFEVRFDADPKLVPEVFYGRLADTKEWQEFSQTRLPAAEIPLTVRRADSSLRYQPAIELMHPEGITRVRLGPQSLNYVQMAPYSGWKDFGNQTATAIELLFASVPEIKATRLGLRYINALRSDLHGIQGIEDLDLEIVVDSETMTKDLNLNYRVPVSDDSSCTVRIASRDFSPGSAPENTTVIVDLDVFTNDGYATSDMGAVIDWKEFAHTEEKRNFFRLLRDETIENLRVD